MGKGGSSGHLWNKLLVAEGQAADSLRCGLGLPQKWSGACSYFKQDEFSTTMKVSLALPSLFPPLARKAYGLLSNAISVNTLDGLALRVSFLVLQIESLSVGYRPLQFGNFRGY